MKDSMKIAQDAIKRLQGIAINGNLRECLEDGCYVVKKIEGDFNASKAFHSAEDFSNEADAWTWQQLQQRGHAPDVAVDEDGDGFNIVIAVPSVYRPKTAATHAFPFEVPAPASA